MAFCRVEHHARVGRLRAPGAPARTRGCGRRGAEFGKDGESIGMPFEQLHQRKVMGRYIGQHTPARQGLAGTRSWQHVDARVDQMLQREVATVAKLQLPQGIGERGFGHVEVAAIARSLWHHRSASGSHRRGGDQVRSVRNHTCRFVGAKHVADEHVVAAGVAGRCRPARPHRAPR